MNTFLPYPSYTESAKVLDRARLGKQRVEGYQILRVLLGITKGWQNHPAVKMWRGYERSLVVYTQRICWEWETRGYKDSVAAKMAQLYMDYRLYDQMTGEPSWRGDPALHLSHQSNLLRKDPSFYGPKFPGVADNLPYVWPEEKT